MSDAASVPTRGEITLSRADLSILLALSRFHYLTAAQVTRLVYPACQDDNRYSQRRLKRLSDAGYLLRLRHLPTPRYGSAPLVFTLGQRGRALLTQQGIEVPLRYRPSEEQAKADNKPFMEHTLAAIDVLIAVERLVARVPQLSCPRLLTERELKQQRIAVVVPGTDRQAKRTTTVIPDAWFQVQEGDHEPVSISVEVDRATTDQKAWRRKVAALAVWAEGPYKEAFATDNLTIAVLTPDAHRRNQLREWTRQELASRSVSGLGDIFLFTDASPVATSPLELFFGQVWYSASESYPVSLLDVPVSEQVGEVWAPGP